MADDDLPDYQRKTARWLIGISAIIIVAAFWPILVLLTEDLRTLAIILILAAMVAWGVHAGYQSYKKKAAKGGPRYASRQSPLISHFDDPVEMPPNYAEPKARYESRRKRYANDRAPRSALNMVHMMVFFTVMAFGLLHGWLHDVLKMAGLIFLICVIAYIFSKRSGKKG